MRDLQVILQNVKDLANTGLKTPQDLDNFQKVAKELLFEDSNDDNGQPRFTDINSEEFKKIIDSLNEIFTNTSLNPRVRIMAAHYAYLKYSSSLSASGLPLTDPYIQGIVHWSQKILDFNEVSDEIVTKLKSQQLKILSSLYQRRKRFDLATECIEKLMPMMLRSLDYKYGDIAAALNWIVAIREEMVKPGLTLQSPEIIDLIKAIQNEIAFSTNIPESKKSMELYISPGQALQQLQAMQNGQPFHVQEGSTADQEGIDDSLDDPTTVQGTLMRDLDERWRAEENCARAKGKLGKLLAVTPKADGEKPDYQLAARWLRATQGSRYTYYAFIDDTLKIPEIEQAMNNLSDNTVMPTVTFTLGNSNTITNNNNTASNSNNNREQDSANQSTTSTQYSIM